MSGRLVLVELRRYVLRAGVRWLVVGMVAIVAMTAFGAWRSSRPPSQERLDQAQSAYQSAVDDWDLNGQQMIEDCQRQEETGKQTNPEVDYGCEFITPPSLDQYLPGRSTFADSATGWVGQVAIFVLLLSLIVGATFVAAEFTTGAITTWLTFEPRRGWVFASKALVVTVATGLVGLVVAALAAVACWAATAINDAVGEPTVQLWVDLGNQAGRIGGAAAAAALLGAALGFLLRHTAAAIAVVIGWFIAIDGLLVQALFRAPRWTVTVNLQAWLDAGATYYQEGTCSLPGATGEVVCSSGERTLSMASGGVTLLVLVAVVTGLSLLAFRRRDVA